MVLPKLRQLEYFIAVIDHGSFGNAAENCHVTQSTLSAGIKDLEFTLGHNVFDRSFKTPTLTPFGQSIKDKCRTLLDDAREITAIARASDDPFSGTFRLGIIPTIAPYALPHLLPAIGRDMPNLDLRIHEDMSARLIDKLDKGLIDCAFMAFPFDVGALQSRTIMEEPFYLARPTSPKGKPSAIKTDTLQEHNILLLDDGHCLRDHALEACTLPPAGQNRVFTASSMPTLIEMVKNGQAETLLPKMVITNELKKSMDIIPLINPVPTRQIGLCWRKNATPDALIDAFADLITSKFLPKP